MNKNLLKPIFILVFVSTIFAYTHTVLGQTIIYKTLTTIPGITTAPGQEVVMGGNLINTIYLISIGIGSILAVVMITISGIQYMTVGAVTGKTDAKKRIWAALGGLVLLLSSYLILKTINVSLVQQSINLPTSGVVTPNPSNQGGANSGTSGTNGGGVQPPITNREDCIDCY